MNEKFDAAAHVLKRGAEYAYDRDDEGEAQPAVDWAHEAARGILYDLTDRKGIKYGFQGVDYEVRAEIVQSLADIIRRATPTSTGAAPVTAREAMAIWDSLSDAKPCGAAPTDEASERAAFEAWLAQESAEPWSTFNIFKGGYRAALASRPAVEAALRDGYQGSTMVPDLHGPKITMRYATTAQADAAHEIICARIDRASAALATKPAARGTAPAGAEHDHSEGGHHD